MPSHLSSTLSTTIFNAHSSNDREYCGPGKYTTVTATLPSFVSIVSSFANSSSAIPVSLRSFQSHSSSTPAMMSMSPSLAPQQHRQSLYHQHQHGQTSPPSVSNWKLARLYLPFLLQDLALNPTILQHGLPPPHMILRSTKSTSTRSWCTIQFHARMVCTSFMRHSLHFFYFSGSSKPFCWPFQSCKYSVPFFFFFFTHNFSVLVLKFLIAQLSWSYMHYAPRNFAYSLNEPKETNEHWDAVNDSGFDFHYIMLGYRSPSQFNLRYSELRFLVNCVLEQCTGQLN